MSLISSLRRLTLAILVTATLAPTLRADEASEAALADHANAALDAGDFGNATADYESLIKGGLVNGHVFFNLGIAYARQGKVGDAMAAFLAARRFLPRDPDVQANLTSTLSSVKDKLDAETPRSLPRTMAFWVDRFTVKEFAYASSTTLGFFSLLLCLTFLAPARRRWRLPLTAALAIPLVLGLSFVAKTNQDEVWGAALADQTTAYSGPSDKNPAVFELSGGAPVMVVDKAASGFLRVELSNGKKGWIAGSQVRVLGPF